MLVVIGLIIKYIWWILGGLAIVTAFFIIRALVRVHHEAVAERNRLHATIARRAERQHKWVLEGDYRGIYGSEGAEFMRYVERDNWDGLLRHIQQPECESSAWNAYGQE
ncbi:hypothetical protein KL859_21400 [Mycolicibacterium goodii]|uniref:Uncharacterized protein n=1 Tax=Mycolicibacterium goodii TaxID=134601 RepID=A0ABS6HU34_MYCGD|nr:hypothetical protein [Mycolicibacterium goodii]MBU8838561.1 hypothetical protein [Mycolicibacterium goodii]